MFENYKATKKDFEAIEEGIKTVWHPKLNFVFKNKKFIKTVIVVSYDSKNLYLWSQIKFPKFTPVKCSLKQYVAYKIPHQFKISDDYQYWWSAGLQPPELARLLLSKLKIDESITPFISGGLLIPFITLQKKRKGRKNNPYTTHESYLATIVHEFGHVYYNSKVSLMYKSQEAKEILMHAEACYKGQQVTISKLKIPSPIDYNLSEVFAFCTDYQAATLFWPTHKKAIDKNASFRIKNFLRKDLPIALFLNSHHFATIVGKLIFSAYPQRWPTKLLCPRYF